MTTTILAAAGLLFAAIPAYFYFRNRGVFLPLPTATGETNLALSILIPARNEEQNIGPCLLSVLANRGVDYEIVVLDDHSDDRTAEYVTNFAEAGLAGETSEQVRLIQGVPLPAGWNGKQHACWQLAAAARNEGLVFLDADVRLSSDALGRIARQMQTSGVDLLSGFPRQVTGSLVEAMLIPLIHFVLLGFLSLRHLRRVQEPGFAAGCGQLFVTTKTAYKKSGGHAAIRSSRHDGLKLPRTYLSEGLSIDLFDATDLAHVRMYDGAIETWNGLAKNADEGIASPGLIVPASVVLFGGQVLPVMLVIAAAFVSLPSLTVTISLVALLLGYLPRLDAARRFEQPLLGAVLHPLGVLLFLVIQWWSLLGSLFGRQVEWKGRAAVSS